MNTEPTTDTEADELTPAQRILAFADAYGVTMTTEFIPWSQSRNKDEKDPSLNFRVTITRNRQTLTTDYSMGCAHCPAYKSQGKDRYLNRKRIEWECEKGKKSKVFDAETIAPAPGAPLIAPTIDAALWALSMDSSVLDSPDYGYWANECGYDPDSRKGEQVYRACLEIALKLRAMLGDDGLRALAEAGQDY
jgi:hypothetical protein